MGDRCQRPRLVPHSYGPPTTEALELFGFPSTFPWTPGPTLPMEPVPYYCIQWPYPVFPLFPWLPPCMVPAISYEVALKQSSPRQLRASPDVTRKDAPPRPPKRHVVKHR
ncbi:hypothetical protein MRX96_047009 [Rhipicephalus microplus]